MWKPKRFPERFVMRESIEQIRREREQLRRSDFRFIGEVVGITALVSFVILFLKG